MQASVPVALPTPRTASPSFGKPPPVAMDFGDELTKLLTAIVSVATTVVAAMPTAVRAGGSPTIEASRQPLPSAVTATLVTAGKQLLGQKEPKPAAADTAPEPQPVPLTADQAAEAQAPSPPLVTADPGFEPRKSSSASDAATARSRQVITAHRDTGNNATASADMTAGVSAEQPVLAPPVPTAAPPPPQPATNVPKGTPDPQTPPATAPPVSNVPEQPLALSPDTPQPATLGDPVAHEVAAKPDPNPEPVTVLAAPVAPTPTLPATPTSQMQEPSTPAPSASHPSPAAQITPALVSMSHASDGAQRLTMKLEPPELGQVQIRIDRPTDAPAQVAITVERPETLQLLLRDQPQLQRALDQAGVPAEGRSVTFHVATPEPSARSDTAMAPTPTGSSAAMGGDLSHGASRHDGRPMQPGTQTDASGVTEDNDDFEAIAVAPTNWVRAGLDITA